MEEDGQDHDSVEDDVLRQKEFRRGGGIDLGQFMIQEPENEDIVEEAVQRRKRMKPLERLPPCSALRTSKPTSLVPSSVMEPWMKPQHRTV